LPAVISPTVRQRSSQFENHLRAVLGLPLGATHGLAPSGIVNFRGLSA
jgi:phosphoribosylaminoimidazole carboxylase (NCAIR synthetase)